MNPREKAKDLFDQYYKLLFLCETTKDIAKQCAIIAIDQALYSTIGTINGVYWQSVKKEIIKL